MPNRSDFNRFAVNPVDIDINRSLFNMDHSVKFSCNVGEVIPFEIFECVPGDTVSIDTTKVVRLQPLVAPIMDEVILDVYYFFVPNRLVWNHWINFMGENTESAWAPTVEYNIPVLYPPSPQEEGDPTGWDVGTIADYLGIPINPNREGSYANVPVSALPFRAYALICDQWFRSEAIMDPVHVFTDDTNRSGTNGSDQVNDIELGGKPFIACKYFDYFTGALPAPQRGDAVSINLFDNGGYVPVVSRSTSFTHPQQDGSSKSLGSAGVHVTYSTENDNFYHNLSSKYSLGVSNDSAVHNGTAPNTVLDVNSVYFDNLFADLRSAEGNFVSINDLRTAFAMQKYLEKQARYGGRYQQFIKGFFGVDSPDSRLQRSEYLGGSRVSLNINQVEQTSATTGSSTPLGNVAGMSVTADGNSDFTKSFTEHGFIIGCAVVRYHHTYQDGLNRLWMRKTPYDFYNPVMANIGEQEIDENEIFYGAHQKGDVVFGYQERWAEYRYLPNRCAGMMRSNASTSLDMWHLADDYSTPPSLSPDWLREDKSMLDRCLAVTSEVSDQVICDFYVKIEASRPMPLYSIPGLVDHH